MNSSRGHWGLINNKKVSLKGKIKCENRAKLICFSANCRESYCTATLGLIFAFMNVPAAHFLSVIFTGFVAAGVRQRRNIMWEEEDISTTTTS